MRAPGVFDIAIIDEAGRAELGLALIILAQGAKRKHCVTRLILIGDTYQGLPRNLSETVQHTNVLSSAMQSFLNAGCADIRLGMQYRMPAPLASQISMALTGEDMKSSESVARNLTTVIRLITRDDSITTSHSSMTVPEAEWAFSKARDGMGANLEGTVALLAYHVAQRNLLARELKRRIPKTGPRWQRLAVSTVTSFQGSEANLVILCTTAKSLTHFKVDEYLACVAFSRAKTSMYISCSESLLQATQAARAFCRTVHYQTADLLAT